MDFLISNLTYAAYAVLVGRRQGSDKGKKFVRPWPMTAQFLWATALPVGSMHLVSSLATFELHLVGRFFLLGASASAFWHAGSENDSSPQIVWSPKGKPCSTRRS